MNATPIRVGIIGVHPDQGWASAAHIPALQPLSQYRIQAISHHDADVAKAAAEKFGAPAYFDSSDALVAQPDVDLVVVSVKVPRHRDLITQALEAGKAVFSEWPLGVNLTEAQTLRDLAKGKGLATSIGLQTRAAPAFAHARDLIRDGYVGEVLSATMIGSGIIWGDAMSEGYAYTLDGANGAAMVNVPFAHSIDGLLHALDARFESVSGLLGNARHTIRMVETGTERPLSVADQIQVAGRLTNGAVVTAHFRGGLSRGTNFHVEINGSQGDLILASPVGYVGIGGTRVMGARLAETLHELEIPDAYNLYPQVAMPAQNIAISYARLASDLQQGTHLSPTFADAVELHRLISAIERSEGVPQRL
ncbi:putative dehydrogenase [Lysobacter niastensis]|uniref:Dehydrogenase n=1 Tax=Lysobacter niastensis TaxID=380629 RepID=A0ABU1WA08_9GAMM|nr:Gfo/Idh/MocA family oxidoreductase [Lysobacter niastensis]MDR7134388.1 putative dehydrogenase [Lysobacter niastensis]